MRSTNLDDGGKLAALLFQALMQTFQCRQKILSDGKSSCHVHRRRKSVI